MKAKITTHSQRLAEEEQEMTLLLQTKKLKQILIPSITTSHSKSSNTKFILSLEGAVYVHECFQHLMIARQRRLIQKSL